MNAQQTIILVSVLIILGFLLLYFLLMKKDNGHFDNLFSMLRKKREGIRDIGAIQTSAKNPVMSKTDGGAIKLRELSHLFKYKQDKHTWWLLFIITNNTRENLVFSLNQVKVTVNGLCTDCNLTLLLEKVPEHVRPPYGNQYFNTRTYNNFILGDAAPRHFIFQARFVDENLQPHFTDSDSIEIGFDLLRFDLQSKKNIPVSNGHLIESFRNIKYRKIQEIDEDIEYLS